jgi:hypothetical protein
LASIPIRCIHYAVSPIECPKMLVHKRACDLFGTLVHDNVLSAPESSTGFLRFWLATCNDTRRIYEVLAIEPSDITVKVTCDDC